MRVYLRGYCTELRSRRRPRRLWRGHLNRTLFDVDESDFDFLPLRSTASMLYFFFIFFLWRVAFPLASPRRAAGR